MEHVGLSADVDHTKGKPAVHKEKLDPTEEAVRKKVKFITKLFSLIKKEQQIAKQITVASDKLEPLLKMEETQRAKRLFPNALVPVQSVQFQQGIREETQVRLEHEKETMEGLEVSRTRTALRGFLKTQQERVDRFKKSLASAMPS